MAVATTEVPNIRSEARPGLNELGPEPLWLFAVACFTILHGLINLANSPGITPDEGWVLQAPHNLLRYGMYGTWTSDGPFPFDPDITTGPFALLPAWAGFAFLGESLVAARLVSLFAGGIATAAMFAVARRTMDRGLSLVLAFLFSLSLYPLNRTLVGEVSGLCWVLLTGWFWLRALRTKTVTPLIFAGLCLGGGVLTKLALGPLLFGTLAACWAISRLLAPDRPAWRALIVPMAIGMGMVAAWYALQVALVGWDGLLYRFDVLAGYKDQNLGLSLPRGLQNIAVVTRAIPIGLLPLWASAVVLAPFYLWKGSLWRQPEYLFWLMLLGACAAYYLASVGWPRYNFWAMSVGVLLVGWMLRPFADRLEFLWAWSSHRKALLLSATAVFALLAVPSLYTWESIRLTDDSGARTARFLLDHAGATDRLGTTDWDIDFLTGRRFKHSPALTIPISQQAIDEAFDWTWPGIDWVVVGQTGRAFGAQERIYADPAWQLRYQDGLYQVFERR